MSRIVTSHRPRSGVALVLFRLTDLRLHDHEPLSLAHANHDRVVHCFCFDPRSVSPSASTDFSRTLPQTNWQKTGPFRAKFLLESVADLSASLQARQHELLVARGTPESVLPDLASRFGVTTVYCHEAEAPEEDEIHNALDLALGDKCKLERVWGNTLYHLDDLPFDPRKPDEFPPTASNFRNKTEKKSVVRPALPVPSVFKKAPTEPTEAKLESVLGDLPTLVDLVGSVAAEVCSPPDPRAVLAFKGGETAALARLHRYFWEEDRLKDYFHTRNGMVGADYSSKFAPWLSMGCLSPRLIAQEVKRYEESRVKNKDTYWMLFELNIRDYFRFYVMRWGSSVFHLHGPKGKLNKMNRNSNGNNSEKRWSQDMQLFESWRLGKTGNPMIDANMRELLLTGFMSNRGRQIVASYLTRDMGLDWRLGAMHFESLLIDHDPCSNWGNWTYGAGVGSDPREDRYFSIPKQTSNYDPEHEYIRLWFEEAEHMSKGQLQNHLTRGCKPRSGKYVQNSRGKKSKPFGSRKNQSERKRQSSNKTHGKPSWGGKKPSWGAK